MDAECSGYLVLRIESNPRATGNYSYELSLNKVLTIPVNSVIDLSCCLGAMNDRFPWWLTTPDLLLICDLVCFTLSSGIRSPRDGWVGFSATTDFAIQPKSASHEIDRYQIVALLLIPCATFDGAHTCTNALTAWRAIKLKNRKRGKRDVRDTALLPPIDNSARAKKLESQNSWVCIYAKKDKSKFSSKLRAQQNAWLH